MRENVTTQNAIASIRDFAGTNNTGQPNLGGFAALFPYAGSARDLDYTFKRVAVFNTMQDMGNAFDYLIREGGMQAAGQTIGQTMDCDQSRMYHQVTVREWADE